MKKRKRKKKPIKKTNIILMALAILLVLITIFLVYKGYILSKYDITKLNLETYDEFLEGYNKQNKHTIDHIELNENEYLTYQNVKVKNIFGATVEEDYTNGMAQQVIYKKKDETGTVIDSFSISIGDTYLEMFSSNEKNFFTAIDENGESIPVEEDIEDYLEANNIHNDLDLFKFLSKTRNYVPNIFTNTDKIKDHYGTHLVASIVMPKINSFTTIEGKYQGYIFHINNIQQVTIEKDDTTYTFILQNKTDAEVLDFLNCVIISEESDD